LRRRWGALDFLRYEIGVIPMEISPFAIPAVTIVYDPMDWYVKTNGKRRNRLEARLPRQARTPIFPHDDDA